MQTMEDPDYLASRRPNFSDAEKLMLVQQFEAHRVVLRHRGLDSDTVLKKQEAWAEIANYLNHHSSTVNDRTSPEVRKKWQNLLNAAKKDVKMAQCRGMTAVEQLPTLTKKVYQLVYDLEPMDDLDTALFSNLGYSRSGDTTTDGLLLANTEGDSNHTDESLVVWRDTDGGGNGGDILTTIDDAAADGCLAAIKCERVTSNGSADDDVTSAASSVHSVPPHTGASAAAVIPRASLPPTDRRRSSANSVGGEDADLATPQQRRRRIAASVAPDAGDVSRRLQTTSTVTLPVEADKTGQRNRSLVSDIGAADDMACLFNAAPSTSTPGDASDRTPWSSTSSLLHRQRQRRETTLAAAAADAAAAQQRQRDIIDQIYHRRPLENGSIDGSGGDRSLKRRHIPQAAASSHHHDGVGDLSNHQNSSHPSYYTAGTHDSGYAPSFAARDAAAAQTADIARERWQLERQRLLLELQHTRRMCTLREQKASGEVDLLALQKRRLELEIERMQRGEPV